MQTLNILIKKGERINPHLLLTGNITRLINVAYRNSYT